MTTLNKLFKIEFERGELEKSQNLLKRHMEIAYCNFYVRIYVRIYSLVFTDTVFFYSLEYQKSLVGLSLKKLS